MKKYPPRPWIIYPANWSQLWIVIPLCLFCFLLNGGGIISGIFLFIFWFIYQTKKAEEGWRFACDHNMENIYVSKDYIQSTGYIKIDNQYYLLSDVKEYVVKNDVKKETEKDKYFIWAHAFLGKDFERYLIEENGNIIKAKDYIKREELNNEKTKETK